MATTPLHHRLGLLLVCFFAVVTLYILIGGVSDDPSLEHSQSKQNVSRHSAPNRFQPQAECLRNCTDSEKQDRIQLQGGDIAESAGMLRLFTIAQERAMDMLKRDYGHDHFANIFEEVVDGQRISRGRTLIVDANSTQDGVSWNRMKRKITIKILEAQIAAQEGCDCHSTGRAKPYSRFVWATGGHSAVAAHGNLFNESYTAFMERLVQPVFAAVGIHFQARNHAMGGTASAPEIAICSESVFGNDIDALSWDYGMTDGPKAFWRTLLYVFRAGVNPSRPAVLGFQLGRRHAGPRGKMLSLAQAAGLAAFVMKPNKETEMQNAVPDMKGLQDAEIEATPPFVRHLKCGGSIEKGDPYCGKMKYSTEICPKRKYQASWHPGWRMQALVGNGAGLWLIQVLHDALRDLQENTKHPKTLLAELKSLEDADYSHFFTSELPEYAWSNSGLLNTTEVRDVDPDWIYRSKAVCHTARLPAEIRYLGILTESDKSGPSSYDIGIERAEAEMNASSAVDQMQLTYVANERQSCAVPLNVDYKDYFFVSSKHDWVHLTLPNTAEQYVYLDENVSSLKGVVIICFVVCDWGRCPKGDIGRSEFHNGDASMEVNGVPVRNFTKLDSCYLLRGDQGHIWPPNEEGLFEIRARVTADGSYMRISSIVVL